MIGRNDHKVAVTFPLGYRLKRKQAMLNFRYILVLDTGELVSASTVMNAQNITTENHESFRRPSRHD